LFLPNRATPRRASSPPWPPIERHSHRVRQTGANSAHLCIIDANVICRIDSTRGTFIDHWVPGPGRLTLANREEISLGLERDETYTLIAGHLGKAVSTVSWEVKANGGREDYRAWQGHERAATCAKRPKTLKLSCPRLAAQVTTWLEEWWSPGEIALRLRADYPDDPMMWVSHETIYRNLFVQGRGEPRRELTRCLPSGRVTRRPKGRIEARGHHADMVMISDRPAEVADRAVPGHWEGDLIIGKAGASAVGTLVERTTRYVLLLHLPDGCSAEQVNAAMKVAIATLPGELFRTITWDQGSEMSRHAISPSTPASRSTSAIRTARGSAAPTRTPTDCSVSTCRREPISRFSPQEDLAGFSRSLNNRPRKTLGIMKPSEKLAELLALT
jgi:IS30 family transposase